MTGDGTGGEPTGAEPTGEPNAEPGGDRGERDRPDAHRDGARRDHPAGRGRRRGPNVAAVGALVLVGVLFVAAGAVAAGRTGDAGDDGGDVAGDPAEAAAGDGWRGTVLGTPQPRPAFTLTDTEGRPYDFEAETRGRLTLLFFGYTSCPDVCPIHMATLAGALEQPGTPRPLVVFVSTDPQRDTPGRLRRWLDTFSEDFVGLRGTPEQVRAAEVAAGVPPSQRGTGEGDDYEVGHASQILAFTPDDQAHVVYPFGVRREDWIADLPRLADEWGGS